MKNLKNLFLLVKNFFFPANCALCNSSLLNSTEISCGLCERCFSSITPLEGSKCNSCGKPLISEKHQCLPCRNGAEKSTDRLWMLFSYTGKYRKLLTEYKFQKKLALADFFAEKMLDVLSEPELKDVCIIPVPPRPGKIKESGWDQVDYLVKRLIKLDIKKNLIVHRCLKRKKSQIQKHLGRTAREENLKGRIYLCGTAPKIALIIDDVITTGSTMEVCASVLKENGSEKVYGLCLFYD